MKKIESLCSSNSFRTFFNRSSKSPLYLVPAKRAPISSEKIVVFIKTFGISLLTIFLANPSAIAVFPTPGSPTNIGLFFLLLHKTCIHLSISSSLPIKGSILCAWASSFKFLQYFFSADSFSILFSSPISSSSSFEPDILLSSAKLGFLATP